MVKRKPTLYTKKVILEKYKKRMDLLNVILKENKMYSIDEVELLLNKNLKRKVN